MPRRRQEPFLVEVLEETYELLKTTPVWVGPILAVVAFAAFRFLVPALMPSPKSGVFDTGAFIRPALPTVAWLAGGSVLFVWATAEVWKLSNRRLVDRQTGAGSIRDLSWQEFERLVGEAYRRRGYFAEVVGSAWGDGGVDVRLTGWGETVLVQCKHWKAYSVDVKTVRELLGVVVSERAARGIVVTSGRFTREAIDFASRNPRIELVDGPRLAELVRGVQPVPPPAAPTPPPAPPFAVPPACPACGARMVARTARRGPQAGSQFWGCPHYPACRGTRQH